MTASAPENFWPRRRVFITGATGLLGGWLTARLRQMAADVVCLIRDWVPHSNLIRSGMASELVTVRGDVRDQALIERALAEYEIQTVYHLAAQTTVGVASSSPGGTLDTNIRGTWVVLEACRATPTVEQVVLASSDKAYGDSPTLPYDEGTPLRGVFPYDVSKSCADLIAQAYARSFGVPVAITRCANLYGGGDLNWNRLIPGTIRAALIGERPVIRSDGLSKRDYLYVEDAVSAYVLLAERIGAGDPIAGNAYNFSCDSNATVLDVVTRVLALAGSTLEPDVRHTSKNEIRDQRVDSRKAREELGWLPQHTMEQGLARTIEWYRQHLAAENSRVSEG